MKIYILEREMDGCLEKENLYETYPREKIFSEELGHWGKRYKNGVLTTDWDWKNPALKAENVYGLNDFIRIKKL